MLYPKIFNIEKGKKIKGILLIISIIISAILVIINYSTGFDNKWSFICIVGILYIWVTTLYSLKRNVNIASHVMLQMICISVLTLLIDYILKYEGWSITFAIPIMITISNITLTVLTIASRKKYIKYAIYQLMIFVLSLIPLILMKYGVQYNNIPTIISSSVATFTLLLTLLLCGKDVIRDIVRRFHI